MNIDYSPRFVTAAGMKALARWDGIGATQLRILAFVELEEKPMAETGLQAEVMPAGRRQRVVRLLYATQSWAGVKQVDAGNRHCMPCTECRRIRAPAWKLI